MIDHKMIPDEVFKAAREAYLEGEAHITNNIRAAVVAALNAWPGVDCRPTFGPSRIILPLPQKDGDA